MAFTSSQPTSLRLSNNASVERLLSDVPFFSVGVMAFAVYTFFLVTKRSNLLATYLYSSALLAFIASILDLGQLLARSGSKSILNDTDSFHGLIIAREIVLSLSVGFRLIFIWGCIAGDPSHREPSSRTADQESLSSFQIDASTSSWEALGVIGTMIKWFLLLVIIAVPVLQIVWRLTSSMTKHGPLYIAESSLEIFVLAAFVFKLLLNAYLASDAIPWARTLFSYTAPFLAIALGLSTGIGNLFYFCFSETTLGRFLQAINLYVLILWVMIVAFRPRPRKYSPRPRPRSSFQSRPERGPHPPDIRLNISHPMPLSANAKSFPKPPLAYTGDVSQPKPSTSRLLLDSPAKEAWSPSGNAHPFGTATSINDQQHISLATAMTNRDGQRRLDGVSPMQPVEGGQDPEISNRAGPSRPQVMEHDQNGSEENLLLRPSLSDEGVSPLPSPRDYRAAQDKGTESPVYSLHGIIRGSKGSAPRSQRNSGRFAALVRERKEMEKTISKLLVMQGSLQSVPSPHLKAGSISGQSEFSLSNFPSPPHTSPLYSEAFGKLARRRSRNSQSYRRLSGQDVPSSAVQSWRDDPLDASNPHSRLGSQGTQYDVTSFIGSGAGVASTGQSTPVRKPYLSDIESGDDYSPRAAKYAVHRVLQQSPIVSERQPDSLLLSRSGLGGPHTGRTSPLPKLKPLYLSRTLASGSPLPQAGIPRLNALNKSRTPVRIQVAPSAHRPLSASPDSLGPRPDGKLRLPPVVRNDGGF